jgi:LysR family transcriptional regulator, carnitine catabolism transcriptional activator
MELRQLEYVLAVIDHGGFTRAAEAVHVAQPTLSQGIRTLEQELGVELFDRVGRGVRLSSAGQAFEPPARRAMLEVDSARMAATEVLALQSGHLSVIALPTLVVEPLVPWIGRFRAAWPGITVHIEEAEEADAVPNAVRDGRADIGLAEIEGELRGLRAETVIEQELVVICPPGAPLADTVSLRELVTMPLVATPEGTSTRRLVESAFRGVGPAPRVAVEVSQREAILPLVLAGAGIAFVPLRIAEQARAAGGVVVRTRPALRRRVGLVRRAETSNPIVAAFTASVRGADPAGRDAD